MTDFNALPEGCISKIISFTTPLDACVVCLVSKLFKSAADSDVAWEKLLSLPVDYRSIVSSSLRNLSKKKLYLALEHPILIEDGKKSISLEKKTGKLSIMLGARDLSLTSSNISKDWDWISVPESRFRESAKLNVVNRLEIHGLISTKALSQQTLYAAYFVFKLEPHSYGFKNLSIDVAFEPVGCQGIKRAVCLNPIEEIDDMYLFITSSKAKKHPYLKDRVDGWLEIELGEFYNDGRYRVDGWLEIELGEFYNDGRTEKELEMRVTETKVLKLRRGLIVQGIEIRPKTTI